MKNLKKGSKANLENLFCGNSEMAERMRNFDWDNSTLGPVSNWSETLKVSIRIVLMSPNPTIIWWGEELVMLYNDAYITVAGVKHPAALGKPGAIVWPEIWDEVGPLMDGALKRGNSWFEEKRLFYIQRKNYLEETFYTYSFSPIIEENSSISAVFCSLNEDTFQILSERRLKTISQISGIPADILAYDARKKVLDIFSDNPNDIPFAMIYVIDDGNLQLYNYTVSSFNESLDEIGDLKSGKILSEYLTDDNTIKIAPIPDDLKSRLKIPLHGQLPAQIIIVPIRDVGQNLVRGYVVMGISSVLNLNEDYLEFFNLLSSQLNSVVTNMRALEFERNQSQRLKELDKAKTTFFNNISHEFRTPLTLILGPLEHLLSTSDHLNESEKEDLQIMHRSGVRLLQMVNNLLNFSQIEAGRYNTTFVPVDLPRLTFELASTFKTVMRQADLNYEVEVDQISEDIFIDIELWELIVLNLLSNAYKFTTAGSIKLRLIENACYVELHIIDTGTGIPKEEIPKLFERFYRVEQIVGRSSIGTGIGLALVAELVKLHGGTIDVISEENKGSEFIVTIPKGKEHLPSDKVRITSTDNDNLPVSKYRQFLEVESWLTRHDEESLSSLSDLPVVLLVDDNPDILRYIRRLLINEYNVFTASNGLEALEILENNIPSLILSDVMMPLMDGVELLDRVKREPRFTYVPFIFLSARAGEEDKFSGLDLGADDYLVKPFTARELKSRIKSNISNSELRREWGEKERKLLSQKEVTQVFLESILDSISDTFSYLSPEFNYVYVNKNGFINTGLSKKDFIGKNVFDVFPHLEKTTFYDNLKNSSSELTTAFFDYYDPFFHIWLRIRMFPTVEGISIFATNITNEKEFELAKEEVEKRFEVIANAAPVLIWMAGLDMNCDFFNENWLEFTGRTLEQEVGDGWIKGVHPEDLEFCIKTYTDSFNKRERFRMEYRLLNKNGEYKWILDIGVPRFTDDNKFVGYIGTCTDITDRKWAESILEQYNKELEQNVTLRTGELVKANEQLQQLTTYLHEIQEQERKLIAREIHDELGQAMAAFKIEISLLEKKLSNSKSKLKNGWLEHLISMEGALDESIKSMREIVSKLRPSLSDDIDLVQDIDKLTQDLSKRVLLPITFQSNTDVVTLEPNIAIEVYRVVQECLTNVIKHANATEVSVIVLELKDKYKFVVTDNGQGFDLTQLNNRNRFGILGIKERVQRIGAVINIISKIESGTTVELILKVLKTT
jgi:PAS domain S-box-containing protein